LEKANEKLLEELGRKELEYADLQEEVKELNEKLNKVKNDHTAAIGGSSSSSSSTSSPPPSVN
jgi:hypothetical protein